MPSVKRVNGSYTIQATDVNIQGNLSVIGSLGNIIVSSATTLAANNTWTGTQIFAGTPTQLAAIFTDVAETANVNGLAAGGTVTYDLTSQSLLLFTANAASNWIINFRGSANVTLNNLLPTGRSITSAFFATNGDTPYYNTNVQVDGSAVGVTTRWQGGSAPAAGNANGVDVYVYNIIKTADSTFSIFASQTRFA